MASSRLGLRRIDHHGGGVVGADALHHIEGVLRVAVQADENDVVTLLQHLRQIVQVGREGRVLPDRRALESRQRAGYLLAALIVRINERNGEHDGAGSVGDRIGDRHGIICFHLPASPPGST